MLELFQLDPILGVFAVLGIVLSFAAHELGHAYVAYWCGDPTPKYEGRLSFNPIKHIDPLGLILILVVGFGFAKPIHTQSRYYKYPWADLAISSAGIVVNLILAILSLLLTHVFQAHYAYIFLLVMFKTNVGLAVFNALPIPPLDGSHILANLLPSSMRYQWKQAIYQSGSGLYLILAIIANNLMGNPISTLINKVSDILVRIFQ